MTLGGYQMIDVGELVLTPEMPSKKIDGIYDMIEGATKPIVLCGEITTSGGVIVITPMWVSGVHEEGRFKIPLKCGVYDTYTLSIKDDDTIVFNVDAGI